MREIKFRAWDKAYKHMINDFNPICHGEMNIFDFSFLARWREGIIPMQYTGLKDKKGKEIYEGDILETGQYTYGPVVVIWDVGTCSYDLQTKDGSEQEHLFDTSGKSDLGYVFWEVIGNIYENPELLGRGDDVGK